MKYILLVSTFFFSLFSFGQKGEMTLYNKGRYVTQTGLLVEGYKEGKWTNVDRRGDTSYSFYKKDKLVFEESYIKKNYGKFKGTTITSTKEIEYNNYSKSEFLLKIAENRVYGLEKNITTPYYSKPYYKIYIQGDSRVTKAIIQQLDLTMTLYPLKDLYGTSYDRDLKIQLPQYGKVDFETNPATGNRKISNVVINLGAVRIHQKPVGEAEVLDGNSYTIEVSDSYFFTEMTEITVRKNGNVLFSQIFDAGLPVSFESFHDNGTPHIKIGFKKGIPHGVYQSYYESGQPKVVGYFEKGVLQGEFVKYNEEGEKLYAAPFVDGYLEGVVSGNNKAYFFKDRVLQQMVEVDEQKEIVQWKSGQNNWSSKGKLTKLNMDRVRYSLENETGNYSEFSVGAGDYHLRYADYPTQDMMIVNIHRDKNNWFALYVTKDQKIKDDINVTVDGVNYREKSRKEKLKLIEKHFIQLKLLKFDDFISVNNTFRGDTVVRTTYYPNGKKALEEKILDGKFTGTRKLWSYQGELLQVANYQNNHNEGLFVTYAPDGKIIEKGNYTAGIKNGTWFKREREVDYEFLYENSNTAKRVKSFYESGKLKTVYTVYDSTKVSEDFDENGNQLKLNIRNYKGKLHGKYKTTYKGKTYTGFYLNGYKHGIWDAFDESGKRESSQNYEYGTLIKNPTREEKKAVCKCLKEFNTLNGSRYFPAMNDFISYSDFSMYFKDLIEIKEYDYDRLFVRKFQNSYSRNNVDRFYGYDMIVVNPKKHFSLPPFKGIDLMLVPCVNPGETGYRSVTINTTKPIEAYSHEFDTDSPFDMNSRNVFRLLLEISRQDAEEFISTNYLGMDELEELVKYLNKKGLKIRKDEDLLRQQALIVQYLEEKDKEEEFFEAIFKKEFDHGKLDKEKNQKGLNKFNAAMLRYFRESTRLTSVEQLEKQILAQKGSMTMEGGRFALRHSLFERNEKQALIYFSCKSIKFDDKIVVSNASKPCVEPNTAIKGTDLSIESITSVKFKNPSYGDNLELNFIGYMKGKKQSFTFQLDFSKEEILGFIPANHFSKKERERVLKRLDGELIDRDRTIRFKLN